MHQNPVKAGIVKLPEEYMHSSAKFYTSGNQGIFNVDHYLNYYSIPLAR